MPFGGVCFIGLILVPFTVTMSRKLSGTQTTQTVLWALTANMKRRLEDVKCQGGREWFYSDIDTLTGLASAIAHELQEQQIYASSARNVKSIRQELGGGFFGHLVYEIDSDDGPQSTDSLEPTVDVEVDETPQPVLDAVATQVAEGIWTRLCKAAGFGQ